MSVPVENRAELPTEEFSHLARSLANHHSIKRAVDWLTGHDPPIAPSGMVTQDEYTHDILVPYPGGLWIVYDST